MKREAPENEKLVLKRYIVGLGGEREREREREREGRTGGRGDKLSVVASLTTVAPCTDRR